MVVVAVRDQDDVNGRERLEGHSRCGDPLGTGEPDGAGALRPDRIHDRELRYPLLRTGFLAGHALRPLLPAAAQTPAQQLLQGPIYRCLARVEEMDAVEVVASRTLIVRVGRDEWAPPRTACLQAALPTEPASRF